MNKLTITNFRHRRKWGWAYANYPWHKAPICYTGTLANIRKCQRADERWQYAQRWWESPGEQWFYDGKPIAYTSTRVLIDFENNVSDYAWLPGWVEPKDAEDVTIITGES